MENVTSRIMYDQGFQNALIDMLNDRMIFKDVCFDNPGFMAVDLTSVLTGGDLGLGGVGYEGCTSSMSLSIQFLKRSCGKRTLTIVDIQSFVNRCITTAITNNPNTVVNLINIKRMENPTLSIEDAYKWLHAYIEQPAKISLFYKILSYDPNNVILQFA